MRRWRLESSALDNLVRSASNQMAKHTKRQRVTDGRGARRADAARELANQAARRALAALAAVHGRELHDVPGDNECLFHALLHALRHQAERAVAGHDALSLVP